MLILLNNYKSMKPWYVGHDGAYKKRKAQGKQGWATPEQVEEYLVILERWFQADYVPKNGELLELGCWEGSRTVFSQCAARSEAERCVSYLHHVWGSHL